MSPKPSQTLTPRASVLAPHVMGGQTCSTRRKESRMHNEIKKMDSEPRENNKSDNLQPTGLSRCQTDRLHIKASQGRHAKTGLTRSTAFQALSSGDEETEYILKPHHVHLNRTIVIIKMWEVCRRVRARRRLKRALSWRRTWAGAIWPPANRACACRRYALHPRSTFRPSKVLVRGSTLSTHSPTWILFLSIGSSGQGLLSMSKGQLVVLGALCLVNYHFLEDLA